MRLWFLGPNNSITRQKVKNSKELGAILENGPRQGPWPPPNADMRIAAERPSQASAGPSSPRCSWVVGTGSTGRSVFNA